MTSAYLSPVVPQIGDILSIIRAKLYWPKLFGHLVGPTEALSRVFLLFFLFSDWLMSNHLKSRIECGFLDIFSRHICSTVKKTIRVTNFATSFGAKKCSEDQVRSWHAEMIVATFVEPTTPEN